MAGSSSKVGISVLGHCLCGGVDVFLGSANSDCVNLAYH